MLSSTCVHPSSRYHAACLLLRVCGSCCSRSAAVCSARPVSRLLLIPDSAAACAGPHFSSSPPPWPRLRRPRAAPLPLLLRLFTPLSATCSAAPGSDRSAVPRIRPTGAAIGLDRPGPAVPPPGSGDPLLQIRSEGQATSAA